MKKVFTLLAVAFAVTTAASAQAVFETKALPFDGVQMAKQVTMTKAPVLNDDELITPPETATIETDWSIAGDYINQSTPYQNNNPIALAFDGDNVYIKGLSYLCGDAWVMGTLDGTTLTIAKGQYVGVYTTSSSENNIYACGSTDGSNLDNIVFTYDAANKIFKLTNFYIENTNAETMNFFFYSSNIVISKDLPAMVAPTNVEVNDIQANQATVNWEGNYDLYNLRYRTTGSNFAEDFENGCAGWTIIDADGDGYAWDYDTQESYSSNSGVGKMLSASYINGVGALHPDNWLITPQVNLGGTLSFYATGQDETYFNEVFAVYVSTGDDPTNLDAFVKLGDDNTIALGKTFAEYTYDLSDYAGQKGYVAIRHYNCTDMFWLNIDDVTITLTDGTDAGEWVVAENVANPYTLTYLEAQTEYEVQVQSTEVSTDLRGLNDRNSEWTGSVVFTTGTLTGIDTVKSESNGMVRYYDVCGRYIGTSLDNAPAGLYIGSNGQKTIK